MPHTVQMGLHLCSPREEHMQHHICCTPIQLDDEGNAVGTDPGNLVLLHQARGSWGAAR